VRGFGDGIGWGRGNIGDGGDSGNFRDGWDIGDRGNGVRRCGERGVVGDGIEATGGGVEFAGEFHTDEHIAPGFVVVGGGDEDGGDGLRSGAVLEEVEDGLAMGRGEWAGAETGQVGVVVVAEKVEGGNAVGGEVGVVGEDGGRRAEEMVSGEQEGVVRVIGSGGEEDAAADGFEQGRRWGR
jgi:hypothetical protein